MLCGDKKITCAASHFIFYHFVRCNALLDALWWRWWLFCISTSVFDLSFSFHLHDNYEHDGSCLRLYCCCRCRCLHHPHHRHRQFDLSPLVYSFWSIAHFMGNIANREFSQIDSKFIIIIECCWLFEWNWTVVELYREKNIEHKKRKTKMKKIRPEEMAIQTYSFICLLLVDDHRIAPAISPTITFDVTSIKKTSTRKKMHTDLPLPFFMLYKCCLYVISRSFCTKNTDFGYHFPCFIFQVRDLCAALCCSVCFFSCTHWW